MGEAIQTTDAREAKRFWSKIWERKDHNKQAEWINNMWMLEEGPHMNEHPDTLKATFKKISNWKTPGVDDIHGFWFKKFTSVHERIATEIDKCIQKTEIPEWITSGKTTLTQKDSLKGTAPNNYWPITCIPMMRKILTAQIREDIYDSLISRGVFSEEQKGCRKGSRGTGDLLYIDQHILKRE